MFIEHRTYTIRPGKVAEYLQAYVGPGWEAHAEHAPCVGQYTTEAGDLFRLIALWEYDSFDDRLERRARLNADPRWREAMSKLAPLVTDIRSHLVVPTPNWRDVEHGWHGALWKALDGRDAVSLRTQLDPAARVVYPGAAADGDAGGGPEALPSLWARDDTRVEHRFRCVASRGEVSVFEGHLLRSGDGQPPVQIDALALVRRRAARITELKVHSR